MAYPWPAKVPQRAEAVNATIQRRPAGLGPRSQRSFCGLPTGGSADIQPHAPRLGGGGEPMEVTTTPLSSVLVLKPKRFFDPRGFFSETYNQRRFEQAGVDVVFVQDNVSVSKPRGTLRGLHFQKEPFAQAKLVGVLAGSIRDVAVDLRRSSPTFGQHFSVLLSAEEGNQIFVPVGFAHAFLTLEPDTMIFYKVSNFYS